MCYAVPGRVIECKEHTVLIDYFGEKRSAYVEPGEVRVGDFVYAQGGLVVETIPEGEAAVILESWREAFARLKERDRRLALAGAPLVPENRSIAAILKKAEGGGTLSEEECGALLACDERGGIDALCRTANRVRQKVHGNSCCVHGIIEFSNFCGNDCGYCGIRGENRDVERYRMTVDEIVDVACDAVTDLGFRALVLQSGEDEYYTAAMLGEIVGRIRARCGVLLILSVGNREPGVYDRLYEAGARGVLMRFETSNPDLYKNIHGGSSYDTRIAALELLKDRGYLIATGSLIGLPGQTVPDILKDITLTGSFAPEMYSFGPLVPHPDTPLAGADRVNIDAVLKVLAVTRILNPGGSILVTSAVESLFGRQGVERGLMAGGNSLMINVTPPEYRERYTIYPGRVTGGETIGMEIADKVALLSALGRAPTDIGIGGSSG